MIGSICCHIEFGMPFLHIFLADIVTLIGAMTDELVWLKLENKQ